MTPRTHTLVLMTTRHAAKAPGSLDEREVLACIARGDQAEATRRILSSLGPELLGFLHHAYGPDLGEDAYSELCLNLVRGVLGFEGRSSLRTWCYALARHAGQRVSVREATATRGRADVELLGAVPAVTRTVTRPYLKTENRTVIERLRDELPAGDRMLLALRVDRELSWLEIAEVLGDEASAAERPRIASRLRKRFERLVVTLRARALEAVALTDTQDGEGSARKAPTHA